MNYTAITIGPIYDVILDTLNDKNKTKRLKAGSYYFSYFMKELAEGLKDNFDIIVPFNEIKDEDIKEMGIYHDRLIACSNEDIETIKKKFESAYNNAFKKIAVNFKLDAEKLKEDMNNHYFFASEEELKEVNENIIFAINEVLDSLEQNRIMSFDGRFDEIKNFQQRVVEGEKKEFNKVKSLEDIAGNFKYYAVLYADGDSMGKKIKEIAKEDATKITELSKKLYKFFTEDNLANKIKNFGGELIFAGGDDILAFLPLISGNKTIFELIEEIHQNFKNKVGEDISMSFGISVVYVKFPLKKAIEDAQNFLYEAKDFRKSKKTNQGAVAIEVMKHSGHYFKSFHVINSNEYEKFKGFIEKALKKEEKIPKGLQYKLNLYKDVIISKYKNENKENKNSIVSFFENIFNELSNEELEEIKKVAEYFDIHKPKTEKELNKLISDFHIVKFIRDRNETVKN